MKQIINHHPNYTLPSETADETEVFVRNIGTWAVFQSTFGSSSGLIRPFNPVAEDEEVTNDSVSSDARTFEQELAEMPPGRRWGYLASHRKAQFSVMVFAAVAWVFAAVSAWSGTNVFELPILSTGAAHAQAAVSVVPAIASTEATRMFTTGDIFLLFLGMFIVWSLLTVTFAKTAEKIQLGSDAVKTLLGFLVGYFTSPKSG